MKIDKITLYVHMLGTIELLVRRTTGCSIGTIENWYTCDSLENPHRAARMLQMALCYAGKLERELA